MAWKLEDDRPIYVQVVEIMRNRIIAGQYSPGDRLPSVRDLALEAGANPNTIQRAFRMLEDMGLVTTNRTNGKT
ncbi:MAG: GntR family transcriptional regulator, partial [Lachnospiraceae bacterium]|nr:GntR family transcriptional regulator [Lachnospiraceae bacterium]